MSIVSDNIIWTVLVMVFSQKTHISFTSFSSRMDKIKSCCCFSAATPGTAGAWLSLKIVGNIQLCVMALFAGKG